MSRPIYCVFYINLTGTAVVDRRHVGLLTDNFSLYTLSVQHTTQAISDLFELFENITNVHTRTLTSAYIMRQNS